MKTDNFDTNGSPEKSLPFKKEIISLMHEKHGFDISCYEDSFLDKTIVKHLKSAGCNTPASYMELLAENSTEAASLYRSLNISYSDFFRNPYTYALLEQFVLPDLMVRKGNSAVRIWSAGCATGQEAWSLAILMEELGNSLNQKVNYRILATDILGQNLDLADKGVYTEADVANLRIRHLKSYFTLSNGCYTVTGSIREKIEFDKYDLLDRNTGCPPASIYGDFDLIMCCNVIYYYSREIQQLIINKLLKCLNPPGYLVTGESEQHIVKNNNDLLPVAPSSTVFMYSRLRR